jgi:hypothetical protein
MDADEEPCVTTSDIMYAVAAQRPPVGTVIKIINFGPRGIAINSH